MICNDFFKELPLHLTWLVVFKWSVNLIQTHWQKRLWEEHSVRIKADRPAILSQSVQCFWSIVVNRTQPMKPPNTNQTPEWHGSGFFAPCASGLTEWNSLARVVHISQSAFMSCAKDTALVVCDVAYALKRISIHLSWTFQLTTLVISSAKPLLWKHHMSFSSVPRSAAPVTTSCSRLIMWDSTFKICLGSLTEALTSLSLFSHVEGCIHTMPPVSKMVWRKSMREAGSFSPSNTIPLMSSGNGDGQVSIALNTYVWDSNKSLRSLPTCPMLGVTNSRVEKASKTVGGWLGLPIANAIDEKLFFPCLDKTKANWPMPSISLHLAWNAAVASTKDMAYHGSRPTKFSVACLESPQQEFVKHQLHTVFCSVCLRELCSMENRNWKRNPKLAHFHLLETGYTTHSRFWGVHNKAWIHHWLVYCNHSESLTSSITLTCQSLHRKVDMLAQVCSNRNLNLVAMSWIHHWHFLLQVT